MSIFGARQPAQSIFGNTTAAPLGQSTVQQTGGFFGGSLGQNALQQQQQQQQQQLAMQQQQQQQQQQFAMQQQQALAQSQASQLGSSLWQPGSMTPHQKSIPQQMQVLLEKWHDRNPNTAFKHYFYNKVDETRIPYYQPQPGEDPKEWEEALQNKPAPGFMPVLCTGFEGLAERLKVQQRAVATYNARLHEINASLDAILSRHDLETSVRSLAARRRHAELAKRCLALAANVQVLRNRGYALSGDEDDLKQKLLQIERSMRDPALSARMEELWSRLIVLRNYAEGLRVEINKRGLAEGEGLGEEVEAKAKKILEDYEKQLQHLKKEVELIQTDFDAWEKEQRPATSTSAR